MDGTHIGEHVGMSETMRHGSITNIAKQNACLEPPKNQQISTNSTAPIVNAAGLACTLETQAFQQFAIPLVEELNNVITLIHQGQAQAAMQSGTSFCVLKAALFLHTYCFKGHPLQCFMYN